MSGLALRQGLVSVMIRRLGRLGRQDLLVLEHTGWKALEGDIRRMVVWTDDGDVCDAEIVSVVCHVLGLGGK